MSLKQRDLELLQRSTGVTDDSNGKREIPEDVKKIMGIGQTQPQHPVNPHVVACLEGALKLAKQGDISALMLIACRGRDLGVFDNIITENAGQGTMILGCAEIAQAKLTAIVVQAQTQSNQPKIMRAPPGMRL